MNFHFDICPLWYTLTFVYLTFVYFHFDTLSLWYTFTFVYFHFHSRPLSRRCWRVWRRSICHRAGPCSSSSSTSSSRPPTSRWQDSATPLPLVVSRCFSPTHQRSASSELDRYLLLGFFLTTPVIFATLLGREERNLLVWTGYVHNTSIISLSLPCFPDFRDKGGYTYLPPGGRPSSTVLYPGPPSSSPRPPTLPLSCLSRCNRAISYVVFLSFSFPSPGEHV